MPVNRYGGLSTDTTLGGSSPSDEVISSQKAIKGYFDTQAVKSVNNVQPVNGNVTLSIPIVDSSLSTSSTNTVQNKIITNALNGKLDGFTLRFAGNWSGGVHAVNFVTIDYSECNSENGVFIKFSMVNSHGNGQAGRFLQDVVLNVKYTGEVAGTLYRYFAVPIDQASSEYYGSHYYGDVFWVNDTTNKIVKFYVLMHQFSYTSQSPYFRLNASTKGVITQSSGGAYKEEYSSGTRVWTTTNWFETDQTYSSTSQKPQSGVAVASAISGKANSADLATVATSGSYNDLSNKPTIPTVNNATLTIQKNSTQVATFTANSSSNVTANITVPTDTNDLTNGAGYITGITSSDVTTALGYTPYDSSNPAGYTSNTGTVTSVNNVSPVNGNVSLSIPTVNNATLTITQGGTTKGTFTANASSDVTIALDAGGGGGLPPQTGNAGKFLTTDGTDESWGRVKTNDLFDNKWCDYELNDQNWLRADTFSWQDGTVYSEAYSHLVADYTGGTSKTETVGSYTISYVEATDGHKITTDETTVANIYAESGVAWYYILDTANQRFKLPRTKYGFVGIRDSVGKYVPESLPNINITTNGNGENNNLWHRVGSVNTYNVARGDGASDVRTEGFASLSSSTYQDNAPVQQRATQMYLYFYVGQFSQSATEQTAGLNSSLFNNKMDIDAGNATSSAKETIIGWGISDYEKITTGISFPFTAPKNGTVLMDLYYADGTVGSVSLTSNGTTKVLYDNGARYNGAYLFGYILFPIELKQGEQISITGFLNQQSRFVEK